MPSRTAGLLPLLIATLATAAMAQPEAESFVQLSVAGKDPVPYLRVYLDAEGEPLLHFDDFAEAAELPVQFVPGGGRATGLLPDRSTSFELNVRTGEVRIGGETRSVAAERLRIQDGALYVHWAALGEWFPLAIQWRPELYEVRVQPDYPLLSEAQRQRQAERDRLLAMEAQGEPPLLEREVPWFDPGVSQLRTVGQTGDPTPDSGLVNLLGVHRFLKGDLEYSLTYTTSEAGSDEFRDDFVRLSYYDDLRTRGLTLGDTYTTFSPLVLPVATFRGISAYSDLPSNRYGGSELIGTAPPGSQVDLFRRGVLIDFTTADDTGFYRFDNIPLDADTTVFEIQIFTPDGRRLIEFQQVSAEEKMLPRGRWSFQGGGGRAVKETYPYDVEGAEVRYGLLDRVTLGAYTVALADYRIDAVETLEEMDAQGLFFLWRVFTPTVLLGERTEDQVSGEGATRWNLLQGLGPATVSLERREFDEAFAPPARRRFIGFSERERELLRHEAELRVRPYGIGTNLTLRETDFGETRELSEQELRLDRRLTDDLDGGIELLRSRWTESGYAEEGLDTVGLNATYRFGSLESATALYRTSEDLESRRTDTFTALYRKVFIIGSPWSYEASYNTGSGRDDLYTAGLGYLFSNNVRVSGTVDSNDRWLLQVEWTAPFRMSGDGVESLPPNAYPRGGVEGTVYLDANGDGERQPTEEPLPDVGLLLPGIGSVRTDEQGHYSGWGVPTTDPVTLDLDMLSMDALFVPVRERTRLAVRPGERVTLNIPVVPAGGLLARVIDPQGRPTSPAEGVELVLEDAEGNERARAPVEWDGVVVMEGIPPGTYTLRGVQDQLVARGFRLSPAALTVEFPYGPDPAWLEDLRFTLEESESTAAD